jgi:hypothetical protein
LNQLSREGLYGYVRGIASQCERDAPYMMRITAIITRSGDGIGAKWNIGEIVVT